MYTEFIDGACNVRHLVVTRQLSSFKAGVEMRLSLGPGGARRATEVRDSYTLKKFTLLPALLSASTSRHGFMCVYLDIFFHLPTIAKLDRLFTAELRVLEPGALSTAMYGCTVRTPPTSSSTRFSPNLS